MARFPSSHPQKPKTQEMFGSPAESAPEHVVAHVDGGARGNPGPSGYGVVIEDTHRARIAEFGRYLGHHTNNFAEYSGLIAALNYALEHKHPALRVRSDSELMVRQMNGVYKVRSPELRPLYEEARRLSRQLKWFRIEHVRREHNADADRLANEAMDRRI
ncbi:MAG: ribonuclease HI family protein [Terriglobales bacterium]